MLLVVMPFVSSRDALAPSSFLFLVAMPGATSSVFAPSSDALVTSSLPNPSPDFVLYVGCLILLRKSFFIAPLAILSLQGHLLAATSMKPIIPSQGLTLLGLLASPLGARSY